MSKAPLKTIFYVDGFNLYYSALRGTPLRWLNLHSLFARLFPQNEVIGIKYFTAQVDESLESSGQSLRQQIYWRALRTLPNLEIYQGHFRTRETWARCVNPPPKKARIYKTEEKGSDVNIASHLLMDAFRNHFECAVVVSGDSDLLTPIRMVRNDLHKTVGVLNPQRLSGDVKREKRPSAGLKQAATFYKKGMTWSQLAESQFPETLLDTAGTIYRPTAWAPQQSTHS
jgi:hypothetical protein